MTIKKLFPLLLAALLAQPAFAARKPRNWRRKKAKPAVEKSTAAAAVTVSTVPAGPPPLEIKRLPQGRWKPEVRAAIEELVSSRGRRAPGYDEAKPPVAVLPFNDALVYNDAGEIVFRALVDRADFRFGDEFWRLVPIPYGRQKLRAAYEQFIDLPVQVWPDQPTYRQYRKGFLAAYRDMCSRVGRAECRGFIARLVRGYGVDELSTYAQAVLREESVETRRPDIVVESAEDASFVSVRRGFSYVPELRDLLKLLAEEGWDVWVIDTDVQQILEVAAKPLGIAAARVRGFNLVTKDDRFTGQLSGTPPIRSGKLEIMLGELGRAPDLAVGVRPEDESLLAYGEGARLVLDRGDARLRRLAADRGWLLQPALD